MGDEEIDFSLEDICRTGHVDVWLAHVPVPFWNFILQNAVIPKCIPGQPANKPVVLMRVAPSMGQNEVGIDTVFEFHEPRFDCIPLLGEEAVLERHDLDL